MRDPEICGQVSLVYIDPPFGTSQQFESLENGYAYDDRMLGPAYIEELRKRLVLIYHLLADCGSLYLHLDERMVFHAKLILDEIFGPENLRNFITRRKSNPKNYTRKTYGNVLRPHSLLHQNPGLHLEQAGGPLGPRNSGEGIPVRRRERATIQESAGSCSRNEERRNRSTLEREKPAAGQTLAVSSQYSGRNGPTWRNILVFQWQPPQKGVPR